ncbi:hypothetical protein BTS2_3375 [Bacillus sp. TS-2]|nr:hypothetical protein BTS2_3375 [Bacillus sp. TS-2]
MLKNKAIDNKAFEAALKSLELEGMKLTNEEQELVKLKAEGKITRTEFKKRVLELAKK